jgi:4-oxalocrotonate tautomerase
MSGDVPDVRKANRAEHDGIADHPDEESRVALIQVKLIAGVFTASQKQEMIERLTDAIVQIEGENMRRHTWCLIEEVASGEWGIAGQTPTTDDVKAIQRG